MANVINKGGTFVIPNPHEPNKKASKMKESQVYNQDEIISILSIEVSLSMIGVKLSTCPFPARRPEINNRRISLVYTIQSSIFPIPFTLIKLITLKRKMTHPATSLFKKIELSNGRMLHKYVEKVNAYRAIVLM